MSGVTRRRLSKEARRQQLLETARKIVREEGADFLTLGHLAQCAKISKPVVYDHFSTRAALLIELYRWIDTEVVRTFQEAMAMGTSTCDEAIQILSATYIRCASDMNGEFHAVGNALSGNPEKAAVLQDLLDNNVRMFVSVLRPYLNLTLGDLTFFCVGLVGSGESLANSVVRGKMHQDQAARTLAEMMRRTLCS